MLPRVRGNPITKPWLLKRYLFGLDLTDDNGDEYPTEVWTHGADVGLEQTETNLDILVLDRGRDIVERQDYEARAWDNWQWLVLNKGPIRRISKVELVYGGDENPTKVVEIPRQWVRIEDADAGQVQIVPSVGTLGAAFAQLFGGTAVWFGLASASMRDFVPGLYRVTYRAGFYPGYKGPILSTGTLVHAPTSGDFDGEVTVELDVASGASTTATVEGTDKDTGLAATEVIELGATETMGRTSRQWSNLTRVTLDAPGSAAHWQVTIDHGIPSDVLHCMGMYASMFILNPAGDMIGGAGIASKSVSMDGLSQSVSTTSSPMFAGYGSRLRRYDSELEALIPLLRSRYRRGAMAEVA